MARIAALEPPYEPTVEAYLAKLMPPGSGLEPLILFRTLAVHVDLASRMRPLAAGLLAHPSVEPRERELMILRTCALSGAEYEWGVHAALFSELMPEEIAATVDDRSHTWSESDSVLISLADELYASGTISDQLWEQLRQHYSEPQLLELIVLAGWYRTISNVINALRIEHEPWAPRFPNRTPDGHR
jgi:alkylhydroperoxidase family enzyme